MHHLRLRLINVVAWPSCLAIWKWDVKTKIVLRGIKERYSFYDIDIKYLKWRKGGSWKAAWWQNKADWINENEIWHWKEWIEK